MKLLVTGAAGFIGSHVSLALAARGDKVIGIDNINDYYDTSLKYGRLDWVTKASSQSTSKGSFSFQQIDISDQAAIDQLFTQEKFDKVIHLAAQAGVRYSLEAPRAYIDSNIVGYTNILEACRQNQIQHLVYASSSSVYGANEATPFSVKDNVDHPLSLYAATKKANELMAHTYSHLYQLPTTGLRFFTVYGPWGRPDMSPFLFADAILNDRPLKVFNYGNHRRDFTYIDDVVEAILRVLDITATGNPDWSGIKPDPSSSRAPWKVYNVGCGSPVPLMDYIGALESALGKSAQIEMLPLQPGDLPDTVADTQELVAEIDCKPAVTIYNGIGKFADWYRGYYQV